MVRIKLFFLLISFLTVSYNIQAQDCKVELDVIVDGSKCGNGKAEVTINAKTGEGGNLNLSNNKYIIMPKSGVPTTLDKGVNKVTLAPGEYTVYSNENSNSSGILCNGKYVGLIYDEFSVQLGLNIVKAEYIRCSDSDVSISVTVLGGTGPYTYELLDGNGNVIDTKQHGSRDITFPTNTSSSNLKIRVTDESCDKNSPVIKDLEQHLKIDASIIEGDRTVCKTENISLSVKSTYSGRNFLWKKGDKTLSETRTLNLTNITEVDAGEYSFSMIFEGCDKVYTEKFTIEVGSPPTPNVLTAYICLNSGEISLSKYVSTTSDTYTVIWYNTDNSLIGKTAPMFNPNSTRTVKYLVSQRNATDCESPKVEFTVIVEDLPVKTGENNIRLCTSNDSKPRIRVVNAGDYTYNLYTSYKGGTKMGFGEAVNDTAIIETTQDLVIGSIYYLETQNKHGCVSSDRTLVPISLKESWILGSNKICFGDNLSLSADYAGGKIVWTKPDNSINNSKTLTISDMKFEDAGIYNLLIEDSGLGCTIKDKIHVTVTQPAPPAIDKDLYRFHENETATPLIATPKEDYFILKWYNSENTLLPGQSPVPATNKTGVFYYSVSQDSLGCESPKVQITVIVGSIPSAVPNGSISICIADKPVIKIINTIQDYEYTVYYKDEVIAKEKGNGGTISLTSNISISENTELGITVSDNYGVSSEPTKVNLISINNLIDLQNSTSSICDGSTGQLVAVDISGANYVWTTPNGTIEKRSISITNASSADTGIYTLSVTTSGCPAAKAPIEVKVEKPAKPSTVGEVYYCKGDNAAKLTAITLPGYKSVWFDESQTQLPDAPTPNTLTIGTSTYYVSQISISDVNCSSDMEKITVIVEDKPDVVVLDPVNICSIPGNTQPVSVRVPVSSEGYIYSLYFQENDNSIAGYAVSAGDGLPVDIIIKDSAIVSGKIYYLEVTNKAGCMSDKTPVEIVITEITLSPDELPPYQVNELYSQRLTTNVSEPQYAIVQGDLPIGFTLSSMGEISGTASTYADPSIFTVEVTSSLGCSVQKEYTLKSELLVSKMFSPNGDGINDVFMKSYKVIIFDRLGRKLFSGDDGWDGTYHGKVMPEDVYYYILYYKDKDGKENHVTSYVTLIKTM